jgi:hypothetical protein
MTVIAAKVYADVAALRKRAAEEARYDRETMAGRYPATEMTRSIVDYQRENLPATRVPALMGTSLATRRDRRAGIRRRQVRGTERCRHGVSSPSSNRQKNRM